MSTGSEAGVATGTSGMSMLAVSVTASASTPTAVSARESTMPSLRPASPGDSTGLDRSIVQFRPSVEVPRYSDGAIVASMVQVPWVLTTPGKLRAAPEITREVWWVKVLPSVLEA